MEKITAIFPVVADLSTKASTKYGMFQPNVSSMPVTSEAAETGMASEIEDEYAFAWLL